MNDVRTYAAVGVSKSFSSLRVLQEVDFELRGGEVHALVGENGSGKSTLIKVLSGVHHPTAGRVQRDGNRITLNRPADAKAAGLAVVHQDYQLFPTLDIAANVALGGPMPRRPLLRTLDRRELRGRATQALKTGAVGAGPGLAGTAVPWTPLTSQTRNRT